MLSREYWVAGNRYLGLLFTSEGRHARTIEENDTTMLVPRLRVTSQIELWWCHKAKSEKTILGENG